MNRLIIALALIGWALSGYLMLPGRSPQLDLQAEVARLRQVVEKTTTERNQLADTLEQLKQKNENLQHLQKQIAATRQELKHLEYLRARVSGEIDGTRSQVETPADQATTTRGRSQAASSEAQSFRPPSQAASPSDNPAPSVAMPPSPSKDQVRAAQEALTALGYGQLKPDGMVGPGTRRAIEAFERAKGLPVTGSLGAGTLQALLANQ